MTCFNTVDTCREGIYSFSADPNARGHKIGESYFYAYNGYFRRLWTNTGDQMGNTHNNNITFV